MSVISLISIFLILSLLILPLTKLIQQQQKIIYFLLVTFCIAFANTSIYTHTIAPKYFSPFYFVIPLTLSISILILIKSVSRQKMLLSYRLGIFLVTVSEV